ncbi:MAG TPA: PAS domain S-box protein [Polyangia bacterium]|nr:PAS domain S-box protein [Polyangia bacterium]
MAVTPPQEWLARVEGALALNARAETRAALAALLAEIGDEQSRLRERYELLASASFEGLLIHADGKVIEVNDRLCEMHGYERHELLSGDILRMCVAPEDVPGVLAHIAGGFQGEYIVTGIRKDGSRFRSEVLTKQGRLGERPVRIGAIRDVTERERTNALLRESEAQFRELAEAAFDMTLFTRDGVILDVRGATERVLGRSRAELVGRKVFEFMAPSAVPEAQRMVSENRLGFIDVTAIDAAGDLVPTLALVVSGTLDGQPVRVAAVRDMRPAQRLEAERRGLEQQVQRTQRLDSLGVLAGGIAHDFNNLLAGVLGNAEILRDRLTARDDQEIATAIITAAQRAAALTRQMLAYAGQRDLGRREPVDVGQLVQELRGLLGATLSKKAEVELLVDGAPVVMGDQVTLGQVVMNLLTNASDALGERPGRISVRVRRVSEVDARWDDAQGATVGPGRWVLVEVEDTGAGMDEATRGRAFEPFFSTKEKGHGLGLAACLGIVRAHGGALLVESALGRGSRFSVLLPASDAATTVDGPQRAHDAGRPCRVLVVDDEAIVRGQMRRSLELRGYTVVEAADGRTALDALAAPGAVDVLDVVILDMTMPDLDGAEVLLRLRAAGSRVPVVVSSGYLDVAVERRLPRGQFQGFLAKPYSATELVNAIERARAR